MNNRFLEFTLRIPRLLNILEVNIKNTVSEYTTRGTVTVVISWSNEANEEKLSLNADVVEQYIEISKELAKNHGITGTLTVRDILAFEDCIKKETISYNDRILWKHLKPVLEESCMAFTKSRGAEGKRILVDVKKNLTAVSRTVADIERRAPLRLKAYSTTLQEKIATLTGGQYDPARFAMEIALMADKMDISEECTRLRAHGAQMQDDLKSDGPVGKRLNFILQEMNREANTICSKAGDHQITSWSVALKEHIEKIREQIQNIE